MVTIPQNIIDKLNLTPSKGNHSGIGESFVHGVIIYDWPDKGLVAMCDVAGKPLEDCVTLFVPGKGTATITVEFLTDIPLHLLHELVKEIK